jgi:hypothetical protein
VSVNRRGVVTMLVKADRNTTGRIRLTAKLTAARVRIPSRRGRSGSGAPAAPG